MILRRNPHDRFSTVTRSWDGKRVVLIGGGPSLTREQCERVRIEHEAGRVQCIAVNDAYLWVPFADLLYFADSHWYKWHRDGIPKPRLGLSAGHVREAFAAFKGQRASIQDSGSNIKDESVHVLKNRDHPHHGTGLSTDPGALVTGRNGGFQVLNIATLAGSKDILLLGYDAASAKDGATHWHGDHPRNNTQVAYQYFRQSFASVERTLQEMGVRVANCSPRSEINTFPKMTLEDALARVQCAEERATVSN